MCAAFDDGSLALSLTPADPAPALAKIAALLATGYAVHLALSPPNPPPAPKTCIDNRTLFERAIRHVTFCTKMMTWVFVLADALVTLHLTFPSPFTRPLASALLPSSSSLSQAQALASVARPSALLLLGAVLATFGGWLRLACFRALGALFTFELTISPTHTLITDGPYAHVRHPSYTGVYATLLGSSAVMLAPRAWLHEAWLRPSMCALGRMTADMVFAMANEVDFGLELRAAVGGDPRGEGEGLCAVSAVGAVLAWVFVVFWVIKVVYALKSTNTRVVTEDRELHRVFGTRWEEWAARVRWRLVPGVY